jgi:hypothetical protein
MSRRTWSDCEGCTQHGRRGTSAQVRSFSLRTLSLQRKVQLGGPSRGARQIADRKPGSCEKTPAASLGSFQRRFDGFVERHRVPVSAMAATGVAAT